MRDGGVKCLIWCTDVLDTRVVKKKNNDEKMREKKISRPGRRGMEEV